MWTQDVGREYIYIFLLISLIRKCRTDRSVESRWRMMWDALRSDCQYHQNQTFHIPPAPTFQTCGGLGWCSPPHDLPKTVNQSQQQTTCSPVLIGGGTQTPAASGAVCMCVLVFPFKQAAGHSCWVKGIWGVCRCVCVFRGVWPRSHSLHRESSPFHKCIKVSSQRDKNTQRQTREWLFRGVESWLTD